LELALIKLTTETAYQNEILARLEQLEQTVARFQNSGGVTPPVIKSNPESAPKSIALKTPVAQPTSTEESPAVSGLQPEQGNIDWDAFLEKVKQKKRTVGALIQEGKAVSFDGTQLVVEFPPNLKFHIENLALPQNKELLENILLSIYGKPIKIACVPQNDKPRPGIPPEKSQGPPDVLQQAVSLFGGKVEPISKEE
jgi:hypothetical protein